TAGGVNRTRTSYFYNFQFNPYGRSWGVIVNGDGCGKPSATPSCSPIPTPDASGIIPSFVVPSPDGSSAVALPCPPQSEMPSGSLCLYDNSHTRHEYTT